MEKLDLFIMSIKHIVDFSSDNFDDFQSKLKINVTSEQNPNLLRCLKYFTQDKIKSVRSEIKKIATTALIDRNNFEEAFIDISECIHHEIKNFMFYAKLKNYSKKIKNFDELETQELENLAIDKYANKIWYEKFEEEIIKKEGEISR